MRLTFKTEAEKQAHIRRSQAHDTSIRAAKQEVAEHFRCWLETNKLEQDFVRDVAQLPYQKRALEYALLHAIANEQEEERACSFAESLLNLAHYQENVGDAVTLPDFDPDKWMELNPFEALKHMVQMDLDKFHELKNSVYSDRSRLAALASQALTRNVFLVSRIRRLWNRITKKGQYSPYFKGYIRFPTAQPYFEIGDFRKTDTNCRQK